MTADIVLLRTVSVDPSHIASEFLAALIEWEQAADDKREEPLVCERDL